MIDDPSKLHKIILALRSSPEPPAPPATSQAERARLGCYTAVESAH